MRIVIFEGATSSSVYQASFEGGPYDDYLGGPDMRQQIADADVVIGIWPPERRPIVVRAPEGVVIESVDFAWAAEGARTRRSFTLMPSVPATEFAAEIEGGDDSD